jgi:hypothetical protein
VKGKNDIYDPRTETYGYSTNPALILADYKTMSRDLGGYGESWNEINTQSLITAANICDEDLAYLYDGATEKRYYLGGEISTGDAPSNTISEILSTMAGYTERINGKWHINAGVYNPPTITLTEDEMAERPNVTLNQSSRDTFNSIRALVRAPQNGWEPATTPSIEYQIREDIENVIYDGGGARFMVTHSLEDGDRVRFTNWLGSTHDNTKLPNGLTENAYYYVVSAAPYEFGVALTENGSPLVLSDNNHTQLIYWHDPYLTKDGIRKTQDTSFKLVNSIDLARRLLLINLRTIRQNVTAQLKCKLGTAYACPFDIQVGDNIRWIDSHKDFWEPAADVVNAEYIEKVDNPLSELHNKYQIYSVGHGLSQGDAIVFTDSTGRLTDNRPYYVSFISSDYFGVSLYRGGEMLHGTVGGSANCSYRLIQGKLFKVDSWSLDLSSPTPLINLSLIETIPTLYDWTNQNEVEIEDTPGITIDSPLVVNPPTGFSGSSGTSTLFIRSDGTLGSRVLLTWDRPTGFVAQGGYVEIQYKRSPYLSRYDSSGTHTIYPGPQPTSEWIFNNDDYGSFTHNIADGAALRFVPSGSDTLPSPLSQSVDYFLKDDEPNSTILAVDYPGSTEVIDIVGTGIVDWTPITGDENQGFFYVDIEDDYISHGNFPGITTQTYIDDIKDGEFYDFRIRFRNAVGVESDWVYLYNFYHSGKLEAPNPVTQFTASYDDTSVSVQCSWIPPTDLDYSYVNISRKLPFEAEHRPVANIQKGTNTWDDFALFQTGSALLYDYRATAFDTSGKSSEIVSSSTIVDGVDSISNLQMTVGEKEYYGFTFSWDNDSADDWIAIQHFDYPLKEHFKTEWFKVQDTPRSVTVPTEGIYHARAWRYRFQKAGSGGGFSNATEYVSASVLGYGELLPPLAGSITTTAQTFDVTWATGSDAHPLENFEVYINSTNSSGTATLLGVTTDTHYSHTSPLPDQRRYFWVKKRSVVGDLSDFSEFMVATCGWDMDKTRVLNLSNNIIYDPPLTIPSGYGFEIGKEINRGKRWNLNFDVSQSFYYGPQKWQITVENNDSEDIRLFFSSYISSGSSLYDLSWWGTEPPTVIAAGSTTKLEWAKFKTVGQIDSPYKGYTAKVLVNGYHANDPDQAMNNVTVSLDETYLYGQLIDTPESIYG